MVSGYLDLYMFTEMQYAMFFTVAIARHVALNVTMSLDQ